MLPPLTNRGRKREKPQNRPERRRRKVLHFHEPVGRMFGKRTQLQNTWNVTGPAFSVSQSINRVRPTRFLQLLRSLVVTAHLDLPLRFYGNDANQNNFTTKFVELMCKKCFIKQVCLMQRNSLLRFSLLHTSSCRALIGPFPF